MGRAVCHGPAWCPTSSSYTVSSDDSILFVEAETLRGNQSYILHLALSKPGRTDVGWAEQSVMVLSGDPPAVAIQ